MIRKISFYFDNDVSKKDLSSLTHLAMVLGGSVIYFEHSWISIPHELDSCDCLYNVYQDLKGMDDDFHLSLKLDRIGDHLELTYYKNVKNWDYENRISNPSVVKAFRDKRRDFNKIVDIAEELDK